MAVRVRGGALRGARGTAIAAAAMAALTASQAPGTLIAQVAAPARQAPPGHGPGVSGGSPYRTELPPLRPAKVRVGKQRPTEAPVAGGALPATVFAAYRHAESELARTAPGCRLRWQLPAAIGQVESGQARGGRVSSDGTTLAPILGPRLDGGAFALIRDSDGGAYDGDTVYDRAVGPMQFIPSTWAVWGADGNGDGQADPNNVFDAALAAGRHLCAGGRDLSDPADLNRAIIGYNHSAAYLSTVRAWYTYFLDGHRVVPDRATESPGGGKSSRPSRTTPEPSPKPSGGPGIAPPRRPSFSPSPSPTGSRPADGGAPGAEEPAAPGESAFPVPGPGVELPGDDILPGTDPLASEGRADAVD